MKQYYIKPGINQERIFTDCSLLTASLNGRVIIPDGDKVSDEEEPIVEADIKELERNPWEEEQGLW